ncbi:pilus assembly protein CpaA [Clostridium sp. MCC353]|uniref:pilus assembly protein CpaA n=1 Tax=Clostridium sp. MCC353 TaxID=2592646 RepID=UPI001C014ED6|nr:pilus assembly protein CpaA [Clostridium sp. MCC353]MBT9776151.1 pilus assembly protein CpaA [Clostridium sp. MCC353]
MKIRMIVFLLFWSIAAWQDLRVKSVSLWVFIVFGAAALLIRKGIRPDMVISAGIGLILLGIGMLSQGAIGEGDGMFFLVSGLYLPVIDNCLLLLYGLLFCSIFSVIMIAAGICSRRNFRGRTVPFLPFLLPAGIWMACL